MKPKFITPNRLFFSIIFFFLSPLILKNSLFGQGTATGVPTFHCIGIYWSGSGGSAGTVCNVQYRVAGSGAWKNGYPLWFDSRSIGGRPSNEYRGSIVGLQPGTNYEIQLTAGSATKTFTTATWSETFPVGSTTNLSSPATISTSGTPTAYRVYTGSISGGTNNITVDASYIIIRNMTLTGAGQDAIVLGQNAHHVVVEGCDISGWGAIGMGGNNQGAVRIKGFSYNASNVKQIIIQRNKMHDSRENSNSWDAGGHPMGPNAITFDESGGNHVVRYNEIYNSSASQKFMDGIGGGDNFTFTGAPGANSDIYANKIEDVYDDAIEAEGSGCNVRIWGNWMDNTFTGVATATVSIGPMYVFNNVSNVSVRSPYNASAGTIDNEDRGPFNKCGSQDATYRGGRTYLFHNTILQPTQSGYAYPRGMGGGPVDNGGPVANVFSRNNIWQTYRSNHPPIGEWQSSGSSGNSYNYDLYNGSLQIAASGSQEANGINGTPTYAAGVPLTGPNPSGYFLASGSNGVDKGTALNNFNDGYTGLGPDIGAYEIGKPALQFGVNAYLTSTPPTNLPPVANAGNDITITLPIVTTTLNGSGSDPDGTIASYSWSKVSGPATFTLGTANAAITTLINLVQGTYVFRLTVTDNKGATATDDVTVTVNPLVNVPPTANAGTDKTLTLPANSTTLTGSGTDAGGTISAYAWTRVSGPTTFSLATANAATTTVNGLVQGTYVFRLTVTDNNGATGTDDVTVTVNAANQPPVANAGADKILTLPTNSTTLNGSGTDANGTISSYVWTRVSGPTTFTLSSANSATTSLSNLVQGTYIFRLTVTDNNGATGTDDVTVTVNNSTTNQVPTANAGYDKTIILPAPTTATLSGSGTDANGTISSYSWSKLSGPATLSLTNANTATATASNLVEGTYVFRLTVTDNVGATGADDMSVTVINPQQPPAANNTGTASGVSTFECIGLYWSGSGGSASTVCNVKYRVAGSGSAWKDGYPLWFDSRAVGGRPANEYRGSLVGLQPGTNYEIQLTAGSASNTFTVATWSENFPIGYTQTVANSSSTLNITTSGTASGYRLYTPAAGQTATINVNNNATNCIYINASYVIVRGLILKDAREDAILLGPDAHDVVIENNDISGWGQVNMGTNNQAAVCAKGSGAANVARIIIQRNKIHESRANSNSWDNGGHPLGPNGINFENSAGNHVFRYNDIYGNSSRYFMDAIGGGDNFSYKGFPNANSDIYGNKISQVYDDAIESEGANCNVRIWGNFINNAYTGIATASTSIGPVYVFRNITNVMQRSTYGASPNTVDNEDRGPFNKGGGRDATYTGGRTYLFHNTTLQPTQSGYTYTRGTDCGPADYGGPVTNVISRNNIWQTFKSSHAAIVEWESGSSGNHYDYDLYNGSLMIKSSGAQETYGIKGTPTYANAVSLELNPAGYFLAPASKGVDAGQVLFGFSDGYTGTKPDMGAYESGRPALQFGVDAYQTQARTTSELPVAKTENDKTITTETTFSVYPNPTSGTLVMQYAASTNGRFNVAIFDAGNKLIWGEAINKNQETITKSIDVSRYPAGVYVIQITSPDGKKKSVSKFVKM